jgi:hypothetical protein
MELLQRLEKVERENRLLRRAVVTAALGVASLLVLGLARPPAQTKAIETEQITVRDPANGNRAVLNGEGLTLYDANGRVRVELKEGKTGPKGMEVFPGDWLKLYDDTARPAVELTEQVAPADFVQGFAKEQSTGNLVMLNYEDGSVSAANLGVGTATGLWLTRTRLERGSRWPKADDVDAAVMIEGGSTGVQVQEHGNARIGLFSRSGMSGLSLADASGYETQVGVADFKNRTTGEIRRTSAASIVMVGGDKNHHVIWKAP